MTMRVRRRMLVPEVVQTSAMDCGPAVLKAMLEGFAIPASYGRLREACQTDVDGTSIDTLEGIAQQLGLAAEQVMLPVDHLLLPEAGRCPPSWWCGNPTASPISCWPGGATGRWCRSWTRPWAGGGSLAGSFSRRSTFTNSTLRPRPGATGRSPRTSRNR